MNHFDHLHIVMVFALNVVDLEHFHSLRLHLEFKKKLIFSRMNRNLNSDNLPVLVRSVTEFSLEI